MSRHLTSEQLDTVLAGHTSAAMAEHLSTCADCAAELDSMRLLFTDLRETSSLLAQRTFQRSPAAQKTNAAHHVPFFAWGVAAAALLIGLLALPFVHHRSTPQQAVETAMPHHMQQPANSISDEALLSSIQEDLNDNVPDALQPLASSTSSTSSTSTDTTSNRKN